MTPATRALFGVLGLAAIGVGAIVFMQLVRPEGIDTHSSDAITTVLTVMAGQLFIWLKTASVESKTDEQTKLLVAKPNDGPAPIVEQTATAVVAKLSEKANGD